MRRIDTTFEDLEYHFKDRVRQVLQESGDQLPSPEALTASVEKFLNDLKQDRDMRDYMPRYKVLPSTSVDGLSQQVDFEVTLWDPVLARRLYALMDPEYQALIKRVEDHYTSENQGTYTLSPEEEVIARRHMPPPITVKLTAFKVELKKQNE